MFAYVFRLVVVLPVFDVAGMEVYEDVDDKEEVDG
jgi:hypothetical protein